jgi:RNA 3'-terminal phosphate cyclase
VLLFSPWATKLVLRGGTEVQNSPSIGYAKFILLPFLRTHFNIECDIDIRRRGLNDGGGEIIVNVTPLQRKLNCISFRERGEIKAFKGIIWSAKQEYENVQHSSQQC